MSSAIAPALQETLAAGLEQMGLALADDVQATLLDYVQLLDKWNKTYNLTAVRDIAQMVPQHLLDSLSIHTHIKGERVLDVGTGAGLPGIPLALANPERQFTLLDAALKRIRFVTQAVGSLGLQNVRVVQTRIEDFNPTGSQPQRFETIVSRAFTAMADFVAATERLCADGGQLLAMKGRFPQQEINDLPEHWQARTERLEVPGVTGDRHIVILTRK